MNFHEADTTTAECPNCGTSLKSYQKFCPVCGKAISSQTEKPAEESQGYCKNCGKPFSKGQSACSYCGSPLSVRAPLSTALPLSLQNNPYITVSKPPEPMPNHAAGSGNAGVDAYNASVASGAQRKISGNRKLYGIAGISAGVVVVAVLGVVLNNYHEKQETAKLLQRQQQAYESYMSTAGDFYSLVMSDCVLLEDIGNDVKSYWYSAIWDDAYLGDIDYAVAAALDDNASDVSTVKSTYSTITSYYETLQDVPDGPNRAEMEQVQASATEIYQTFEDFYDLVLSPNGSLVTFTDDFKDMDSEMADVMDDGAFMAE